MVTIVINIGKGGRATGGWVFDEMLRRRIGLSVFFAPSVAKCLSPSSLPSSSLNFTILPIIPYILFFIDITYLYLITILSFIVNLLNYSVISLSASFQLKSSKIIFGSFEMSSSDLFTEFYNEKGVLQLQHILS